MASVCFYFQVHQPFRLRRYSVFDTDRHYFDDLKNAELFRKIAARCYLPANKILLDCIKQFDGKFRLAYSITGQVDHPSPDACLRQFIAEGGVIP